LAGGVGGGVGGGGKLFALFTREYFVAGGVCAVLTGLGFWLLTPRSYAKIHFRSPDSSH
jgi:hypothetical protein